MNRRYIIFFALLVLSMIIIISSLYIAKRSLTEIAQEKKESPAQDVSYRPPVTPLRTEGIKEFVETEQMQLEPKESKIRADRILDTQAKERTEGLREGEKIETEPEEELEFDLDQIPQHYFNKDIQDREQKEEPVPGERKLNKQPSPQELNELKIQGVVIY